MKHRNPISYIFPVRRVLHAQHIHTIKMHATAQFFSGTKDGSKTAFINYATGESNLLPAEKRRIYLHDIRKLTTQPTLQSHGFQRVDFPSCTPESAFLASPSAQPNVPPHPTIQAYYAECEALVRRLTGASAVHAFHHRYRSQKPASASASAASTIKNYTTSPVPDIHVDNDATTAHTHLGRVLPASDIPLWTAPGRIWAILNIWRPLARVQSLPLALLDPTSLPIHPTTLTEPVFTRGNYKSHIRGVRWHPEYRFYYASGMGDGDALVFVDWESGRRWRGGVGHGAVRGEGEKEGVARRSVEVRCLVLYE